MAGRTAVSCARQIVRDDDVAAVQFGNEDAGHKGE
jgi:hypothetical protein